MAISKASGEAFPNRLKWWLIASLVMLLGSLAVFLGNVVAGFVYFTEKTTPLWVTVLGVFSVIGIAIGFCGLFLVFLFAVKMNREDSAKPAEQA